MLRQVFLKIYPGLKPEQTFLAASLLEKANSIPALNFDLLPKCLIVELTDNLPRTHNNGRFDIIRIEYGEDMKLQCPLRFSNRYAAVKLF